MISRFFGGFSFLCLPPNDEGVEYELCQLKEEDMKQKVDEVLS
jgi:hypothetical protein